MQVFERIWIYLKGQFWAFIKTLIDFWNLVRPFESLVLLIYSTLFCLLSFYVYVILEDARMTCETSPYHAFFIWKITTQNFANYYISKTKYLPNIHSYPVLILTLKKVLLMKSDYISGRPKGFAKSCPKQFCWSLFNIWFKCFSVNFAKFFRGDFFIERLKRTSFGYEFTFILRYFERLYLRSIVERRIRKLVRHVRYRFL